MQLLLGCRAHVGVSTVAVPCGDSRSCEWPEGLLAGKKKRATLTVAKGRDHELGRLYGAPMAQGKWRGKLLCISCLCCVWRSGWRFRLNTFSLTFPNRCENNKDSYRTVFRKVNYSLRVKFPQHLKRFEVRMFAFVQGTSLFQEQVRGLCSVLSC